MQFTSSTDVYGDTAYMINYKGRIYVSVNSQILVSIMACHLVGTEPLCEPMKNHKKTSISNIFSYFAMVRRGGA